MDIHVQCTQGRGYEFVIGTAIGEGSWGLPVGPQRVQGSALVGTQGAKPPEAPAF